jgi:putative peptidoglycan lipid II flippase
MSTNNLHSVKHAVLRSAFLLGGLTFLSRLTGFFRDVIIAYFFGTGASIQAFIVAFRLPNLLRDLVGEGTTNTTLVPVFSKLLAQNRKDEFLKLSHFLFKIVIISLVLILLVAEMLSPVLVRLIAPGFIADINKLALAIQLVRITFFYILLIGLVAFQTALLNSFNDFAPSAIAPVLLNISLIFGAVFSAKLLKEPALGLAWAVIVGGILQVAWQIPALNRKAILPWRNFFDFKLDPGVKLLSKRVGKLFLPRLFGSAVYEINIFVDTIFASLSFLVGQGAIAAIYYANRIIQFPIGIFAFSISSALLPQLSGLAVKKERSTLIDNFSFSMRIIMAVMIPLSIFICMNAVPIIKIVFQRGKFNAFSTDITSWALVFYGLGLFFFAAVKVVLVCFYALEDTRRPVVIASVCLLVNIMLNFILAIPLKVGGLALASSISAALNLILLCQYLKRHIPEIDFRQIFGLPLLKVLLTSLVMVVSLELSQRFLLLNCALVLRLLFNLTLASLVYLGVGFLLKIGEIRNSWQWISRRF